MATQAIGDMVHCRECATTIARSASNCPQCGGRQSAHSSSRKSRGTAAVLALLLGGIGVHRFYLGNWWGLFYLVFCWTFIPAFIAFVEFIAFLCTSEESWDRQFNS